MDVQRDTSPIHQSFANFQYVVKPCVKCRHHNPQISRRPLNPSQFTHLTHIPFNFSETKIHFHCHHHPSYSHGATHRPDVGRRRNLRRDRPPIRDSFIFLRPEQLYLRKGPDRAKAFVSARSHSPVALQRRGNTAFAGAVPVGSRHVLDLPDHRRHGGSVQAPGVGEGISQERRARQVFRGGARKVDG